MSEIDVASLQMEIARTGRKLDAMATKVQKTILRKAARAAIGPYVKGLRTNAPSDDRDLKRTMGSQVTTDAAQGAIVAIAGQSIAMRKRRKAVQIHIADQDTKPHTINGRFVGRDGKIKVGVFHHPGTTGAEFVERTATQKQNESLRLFSAKLSAEVEAEASK